MRKIFMVLMLQVTIAVVTAQDAQNPWHLIVFENEKEVAFYNTEMITGIELAAQSVTIVLDNGKEFTHPLAVTTFGFDPRKAGTAMTNESITTPPWNVHYTNDRLHFSEEVNGIAVFTMYGALLAQLAGNHTEVPVSLAAGIYIVQAGGKSAKLFVGSNNGGTITQPEFETKFSNYSHVPIILRASDAIKIYWNITANISTMSVEIPNVENFYFTADNSIVFTMKNGNTIELADYQGVEFALEPTLTVNSNIDWNLTLLYGGATYALYEKEIVAVVYEQGIKYFLVSDNTVVNHTLNQILNNWQSLSDGNAFKLTYFYSPFAAMFPVNVFYTSKNPGHWTFNLLTGGDEPFMFLQNIWSYNGNTPLINTVFTQNSDGSLTISYFNRVGAKVTVTAKEW